MDNSRFWSYRRRRPWLFLSGLGVSVGLAFTSGCSLLDVVDREAVPHHERPYISSGQGGAGSVGSTGSVGGGGTDLMCGGGVDACGADDLACEGFEAANLVDDSWWKYKCTGEPFTCLKPIDENAVKQSNDTPCRGDGVLHVRTEGKTTVKQNSYLGKDLDAFFPTTFFMRVFVRLPSNTHIEKQKFFGVSDDDGPGLSLVIGGEGEPLTAKWGSEDSVVVGGTKFKTDQWYCVEVEIAATKISVHFDGMTAAVKKFSPTLTSTWDYMGLGLYASNLTGPSELYFDDFVLSDNRIGCD